MMKNTYWIVSVCFIFLLIGIAISSVGAVSTNKENIDPPKKGSAESSKTKAGSYQSYIDFFEEVYSTVDKNYYRKVDRANFDRFVAMFNKEIFGKLQLEGKSNDYIRWRSAAYLIDYLKDKEDIFSAFFPPKPAKEYEQKVLGKKIDLGIGGTLADTGYEVTMLEPRSDSYQLGMRVGDIIQMIGGDDVLSLDEDAITKRLNPLEGTLVSLKFLDVSDATQKTIEVESKEYFKQTVFLSPVSVKGVHCLELPKFNRKTSEDMLNLLNHIEKFHNRALVIDLRGNPGGPPLAAREIAAFFLTPEEEFAYFQKRDKPKSVLDVPSIPEKYHYTKPIALLVDGKSGSAAELFSGVMQFRKRAVVIGKNTAGQVFLKSMFNFDDDSMVLLVTARGHYPDGSVFPFAGISPDTIVDAQKDEVLMFAIGYLLSQVERN